MAEVGLIRKRLRSEIDAAPKVGRRAQHERTAAADKAYEIFLKALPYPCFVRSRMCFAPRISRSKCRHRRTACVWHPTAIVTASRSSSTQPSIRQCR